MSEGLRHLIYSQIPHAQQIALYVKQRDERVRQDGKLAYLLFAIVCIYLVFCFVHQTRQIRVENGDHIQILGGALLTICSLLLLVRFLEAPGELEAEIISRYGPARLIKD